MAEISFGNLLYLRRHGGGKHGRHSVDLISRLCFLQLQFQLHKKKHQLLCIIQIFKLLTEAAVADLFFVLGLEQPSHSLQDGHDLRLEAHVHHPICLVQHHIVALVEHQIVVINAVHHSARRSDDDLHSFAQSEALVLDGLPAHHGHCAEVGELGQLDALLLDLLGQLSGGGHYHRQRSLVHATFDVKLTQRTQKNEEVIRRRKI